MPTAKTPKTTGPHIGFRYDETAALFTSQIVVNSVENTVLLECSSGFVQQAGSEEPVLPIESRLAMTTDTARNLARMLLNITEDMDGETKARRLQARRRTGQFWLPFVAALWSKMRAALDRLPRLDY